MNLRNQVAIKIIKPGIFTTIQDLGRNGYRSVGIGPAGAMDLFAASVANILVGNRESQAVIEMHFPAAEILFGEETLLSITGGDFRGYINDEPAGLWKPLLVKKGEKLTFKKYVNGARAYVALHGGLKADNWLNSFSTHTKAKAGGYKGRPLQKEDVIPLNGIFHNWPIENFPDLTLMTRLVYEPTNMIRCIAGPEWELMDDQSKTLFPGSVFFVTGQSDRMGYRLQGRNFAVREPFQLISSPVDAGTIQLLPGGQLIVLMADHQTTGGYPRICNVIGADLPKLAQLPVHGSAQFELIAVENAEEALLSLYHVLESIKDNCKNLL